MTDYSDLEQRKASSSSKDYQGNGLADFQLEACPFCGFPAKMQSVSIGSGWWYGVACRSGRGHGGDCAMEQVPSRTIEAAAKRWNMRKPVEQLKAENEALRKDSERLNWLDGRMSPVVENQNWSQPEGELVGYDWGVFGQCSSVRDAIDDVMSKEPSNG